MLRARTVTALCATALLFCSCSSVLPWDKEPVANEVNMAFVIEHNLLYLPSVTIDNRAGRYFFSTAAPRTVVDPRLVERDRSKQFVLRIGEKETLQFAPVTLNLGRAGDAMLGADVWHNRAISIDYVSGLLTYQKEGIHPALMTLYRFAAEPVVKVMVDGREVSAIVDTASPDTLEIPGKSAGRTHAHIVIAGSDFGSVDVAVVPGLSQPRLGNRLLSKFLVSIDYGRRVVGLWRDPRVP